MPIYEYTCEECETDFEKLSLGSSENNGGEAVACPACGSSSVFKRFSTFGVKTSYVPVGLSAGNTPSMGGGGCCGGMCGCN